MCDSLWLSYLDFSLFNTSSAIHTCYVKMTYLLRACLSALVACPEKSKHNRKNAKNKAAIISCKPLDLLAQTTILAILLDRQLKGVRHNAEPSCVAKSGCQRHLSTITLKQPACQWGAEPAPLPPPYNTPPPFIDFFENPS